MSRGGTGVEPSVGKPIPELPVGDPEWVSRSCASRLGRTHTSGLGTSKRALEAGKEAAVHVRNS